MNNDHKARKQLESNAAAGRIKLTEEQIGKVREIASI